MLQAILDKYINSEVSSSLKIHTNSEMAKAIIETFKLIVEQIAELLNDDKSLNDEDNSYFITARIEEIIQDYYNEQIK